jgi:DNA-binding transcriptional LysR family regulator
MVSSHHLMLFYHVARCRGIVAALPHCGFGIQQPALSAQMLALERSVGTRLFVRRPFQLTQAGEKLFACVQPFYERLDHVLAELHADAVPCLRIGAAPLVIAHYLPAVIQGFQRDQPTLRFDLHTAANASLLADLKDGRLDIAIVAQEETAIASLVWQHVLRVPLALMAPRGSSKRTPAARELLAGAPLVCPTGNEAICRSLDAGLKALGLHATAQVCVDSLAAVPAYVAAGAGIGVGLQLPSWLTHFPVQVVPLDTFTPLNVAIVHRATPPPLTSAFAALLAAAAARTESLPL